MMNQGRPIEPGTLSRSDDYLAVDACILFVISVIGMLFLGFGTAFG